MSTPRRRTHEPGFMKATHARTRSEKSRARPGLIVHLIEDRVWEAACSGLTEVEIEIQSTPKVCRIVEELRNKGFVVERRYKADREILEVCW